MQALHIKQEYDVISISNATLKLTDERQKLMKIDGFPKMILV